MDNTLIFQIIGAVVCFVLLFYFTAKYRQALTRESDFEFPVEDLTVMTVSKPPSLVSRASLLSGLQSNASLEVADLKDKVKDLHYRMEELKVTTDKNNAELNKLITRMEQRITTFEQEYMSKLQPTLISLIEELENIKVADDKPKK